MYLSLNKPSDIARFETEKTAITERARKERKALAKMTGVFNALPMDSLLEAARTIVVTNDSISIYLNDNTEGHEIACTLLDYVDFQIGWGAATYHKWDERRMRSVEIIRRTCQWTGLFGDVHIYVYFNDGPELKEGDRLPSGCTLKVEVEASLSIRTITCDLNR